MPNGFMGGFSNLSLSLSRKLASASWRLLALASIPGAAQGHHVIFHAKGGGPVPLTVGVDFAAPLLVHVGRVEWVQVSRYM